MSRTIWKQQQPRCAFAHPRKLPFTQLAQRLKPEQQSQTDDDLPIYLLGPQERVAPSEVLRSALFGIGSRQKRRQLTDHPIFACGGTQITYTGEQLDQRDLDVFMAAIRMAYDNGRALEMICSVYAFEKMLGLANATSTRESIRTSFKRLTTGTITIKNDRFYYCGHLIDSFKLDKTVGRYKLQLNSEMGRLFRDGYTRINWEIRRKIRTDLGRRSRRCMHGGVHRPVPMPRLDALTGRDSGRVS
ncbi:MAG: plasmid replication initiator TrfA [Myxococcota bacterium]